MKFNDKADKVHKAIATITAGFALYEKGKDLYLDRKLKDTYKINMQSTDKIYNEVVQWAISQIEVDPLPMLKTSTFNADNAKRGLYFSLPSAVEHTFIFKGHQIKFFLSDGEAAKSERWESSLLKKTPDVTFVCETIEARKLVLDHIEMMIKEQLLQLVPPFIKIPSSYGEWESATQLPPRTMDSVILAEGQAELIVNDLQDFLDDEKRYSEIGIPYHRGYLFYGPPGTGKTSFAKALGRHFNKSIAYLSLKDIEKDSTLLQLIANVRNAILVLEDIDVYSAATSREDGAGASLSALLNALDGITTPHGLITIMTTNHEDKLDPALIRSGRIDFKMKIDYARSEQVERLYERFYEKRMTMKDEIFDLSISMSDIAEILKVNKDPKEAKVAIHQFIEGRRNNG